MISDHIQGTVTHSAPVDEDEKSQGENGEHGLEVEEEEHAVETEDQEHGN